MRNIRNFAIIAHIDHGKSTLADRLLELTGVVDPSQHEEQLLDRNPISRERGITIKLAPVHMEYEYKGTVYELNLIDTPGHVDFSYEVERTLACVEGVVLLVDATKGIQAQTIAHTYKAIEQNLEIIPVINKIDMPQAQIESTKKQLVQFLGVAEDSIRMISAKTGTGVKELLEEVIRLVPAPAPSAQQAARALIFDSYYDTYRGVIAFVKVFDGALKTNDALTLCATNGEVLIEEVGTFTPELKPLNAIAAGDIGYVATRLKDIHQVRVGDTMITSKSNLSPIEGYKDVVPMVFSSIFPTDPDDYLALKTSLDKLALNDSALQYEAVYSKALGSGFKTGFLGMLHADVVRQRLENEFDMSIVLTSPTVEYINKAPEGAKAQYEEPIAHVTIVTPQEYTGVVMKLCEESRGVFINMDNQSQVIMNYDIPLAELITFFFDKLKTVTSGYATLQWELKEYRPVDADRLVILLNLEPVEEFSEFVVTERAYQRGRDLVDKLKELIPRQQFEVKIQAHYKGKVIASSRIAPFRKDVTAKLYGGDRTRKDKLLNKQKEGKKKMKNIGAVEVPKDVFIKLFKN
ncbi:MAG: Elongation factor 4 [Microgenomates bacterium OLB23]|nr:MAG: Elongation factor 4 [Microgenomates bacterium OLB23]